MLQPKTNILADQLKAVEDNTSTKDHHTSRLLQDHISPKKGNKSLVLEYVKFLKFFCTVLQLRRDI